MTRTAGKKLNQRKKTVLARIASAPHIFWTALFIVVPIIFVAYYSFTDANFNFTFDNITAFFSEKYLSIFWRSVKLALIATLICFIIGYPAAYFIARSSQRKQKILIMLVMLPMWMNFLIRTYAWMAIMQDSGIINSVLGSIGLKPIRMMYTEGAVIVGMVYDFLPYMILPIYSVMTKLDFRLIEAAQDLGCNKLGVMRRVILPLSVPGIISGITMVFVPSISTFYISQKLGGGRFMLIGDAIESQYYSSNNPHMAAALSFVLMIILLVGLAIMQRFSADDDEGGIVI